MCKPQGYYWSVYAHRDNPANVLYSHQLMQYTLNNLQDIADSLETSQSAISHQLKLLRDMNVVSARKDGKQVIYSLQDNHIKEIFLIGYSHATKCKI